MIEVIRTGERRSAGRKRDKKKKMHQVLEQVRDKHKDMAEHTPQDLDPLGACMYTPSQGEGQDGKRNGYHKCCLKQNQLEEQRDHLRKGKVAIGENEEKKITIKTEDSLDTFKFGDGLEMGVKVNLGREDI